MEKDMFGFVEGMIKGATDLAGDAARVAAKIKIADMPGAEFVHGVIDDTIDTATAVVNRTTDVVSGAVKGAVDAYNEKKK